MPGIVISNEDLKMYGPFAPYFWAIAKNVFGWFDVEFQTDLAQVQTLTYPFPGEGTRRWIEATIALTEKDDGHQRFFGR